MRAIKCDLGSAYPKMAIGFCLDPANYIDHSEMPVFFPSQSDITIDISKGYDYWSKTEWGQFCVVNHIIPIPVNYRQTIEELKKIKEYKNCDFTGVNYLRGVYYFKQNSNAILCKGFDAPMKWKQDLKTSLKSIAESDPNRKIFEEEYDASKRFVNSGFGISGNKYNRLFKVQVFNSITFLVRDLLLSIIPKLEAKGLNIIFIDTDSFVLQAENESIVRTLNGWIQDWAIDKFGNNKIDIRFEYEGYFKSLYVGGKCRYMGYLVKSNGEVKEEIKGLEIKRKNATKFQKEEQKAFFKYLLEGHTFEEIVSYIESWIKRIYKCDIDVIGMPRKLSKPRDKYKNNQPFFAALDNAKSRFKNFEKEIGEKFWYTHLADGSLLAFDNSTRNLIKKEEIDYNILIEKQIFNILVPVFAGLNWGKELLDLAEKYDIQLESIHRNVLLEEDEKYEELKKYYSAIQVKKRRKALTLAN